MRVAPWRKDGHPRSPPQTQTGRRAPKTSLPHTRQSEQPASPESPWARPPKQQRQASKGWKHTWQNSPLHRPKTAPDMISHEGTKQGTPARSKDSRTTSMRPGATSAMANEKGHPLRIGSTSQPRKAVAVKPSLRPKPDMGLTR